MSTSASFASRTAGQENVVIRAGACSVTLLPRFGGKIASLQVAGHELLQQPLAPIAPRTPTMPFDAADASGWDECLPSVAECSVSTPDGEAHIPDHGDLWRVEWAQQSGGPGRVVLAGQCFSLPLALERTLTFMETAAGCRLLLEYRLTNTSAVVVPWSWAAHPLFAVAAGDRIVLPASIDSLRVEGSGGHRLGHNGDTIAWPMATIAGGETDLSIAQAPDSGIGDKLFAGPLQPDQNWCALERPSVGLRIRLGFNPERTPYLGLWSCYGGWPERPGAKQVCVALEPSTAPVDSLAQRGPWSRQLAPGASATWTMSVDIENI